MNLAVDDAEGIGRDVADADSDDHVIKGDRPATL